jgi:RNA polymerase sigma-70 factor (ECF subfamily)
MGENRLLIKQFNEGNRVIFKRIFEDHYRPLCGFSNKFIDDIDVCDDIVQEAFLGLWNHKEQIVDMRAIKSYLYSSVRNACLNYLRHENVKNKREADIIALSSEWYFEDTIVEEEVYNQIYEAIKDLTPQGRKVVIMTMNGLTNPEIAADLDVSINTVKTLKKRAYEHLRTKLKGVHWLLLLLLT